MQAFFLSLISGIVSTIIGILRTSKEQSADLPVVKSFAMKAFGFVENVTYTQFPQAQSQSQPKDQTQEQSQNQSQN